MIKCVKWILLSFLVVCVSILGIKFINYNNADNKYIETNHDKFNISDIYGFQWKKFGISIYEENTLVSDNFSLDGPYNMVFRDDKVKYCNIVTNHCDEYSYSYSDGKIIINSGDYFLGKGTYNLKLKDGVLELSMFEDGLTIVLYFNYPLG